MSGQRYAPPNDNRFRDRSPPRHSDRYAPSNPHAPPHSFRGGENGSRNDTAAVNNYAPRGPRGGFNDARGGQSFAPRGRGYAPRGDHRADFRDREPLRARDVSPPVAERGTWRDRESDRRDRRALSPRPRPVSGELRDLREQPPRDLERRNSRDNNFGNTAHFHDHRTNFPGPSARGGFSRGRGRGDWEFRGRGRGGVHDGRDLFASRSRSPGGFRRPNDIVRDDRPPVEKQHDDHRFERRETEKALEREAREREAERYKREQLSSASELKRLSAPSTGPSTPHQPTFTSVPAFGARMSDPEPTSNTGKKPPKGPPLSVARDARFKSDLISSREDTNKERFTSRASSPLSAPQVPAFGTLPFKGAPSGDTHWNVWRAPVETRPPPPAPPPITTTNLSKAPHSNPPTATKPTPASTPLATKPSPLSSAGATRPSPLAASRNEAAIVPSTVFIEPPTAPKADRIVEPPTPTKPRQPDPLPNSQSQRPDDVARVPRALSPRQRRDLIEPERPPVEQARELPNFKSPPTQPRQMSLIGSGSMSKLEPSLPPNVPRGPSFKSPTVPVALTVPLGPRVATTYAPSPTTRGFAAPTGPKAARVPTGPAPRAPAGPASSQNWHWNRHGPPMPPRSGSIVPVKRDSTGEERRRSSSVLEAPKPGSAPSPRPSRSEHFVSPVPLSRQQSREPNVAEIQSKWHNAADDEVTCSQMPESSMTELPQGLKEKIATDSLSAIATLVEEEDAMDLDEGDFASNENNFEKEKALLESKRIDLSSRYLRGSSPLEQLTLLTRLSLEAARILEDREKAASSRRADRAVAARDELLTPKAEDNESLDQDKPCTPSMRSRQRTQSPDLSSLPFLNREPLTPMSDLDAFHDNLVKHEACQPYLFADISYQLHLRSSREAELRQEYRKLYKPWKKTVRRLDKDKKREEDETVTLVEPVPAAVMPELSPTIATPATLETRRSRGFTTHHDLQLVVQESLESERRAQAKREREALCAKPDMDKEAVLPALLTEEEQDARLFLDTSGLRDPDGAVVFYELEPPKDDFTPREHELLVQGFASYSKKWGKLAQALPGRSYKDCINHYYTTKWNKDYKQVTKDKRRGRMPKSRPRGPSSIQGRPKANALISNLGGARLEADEGEDLSLPLIAMTDSGRPKRAAAPTFGEKEPEESSAATKRTGKLDVGVDGTIEKPNRRPRGVIREKSIRKPRIVQTARQPSMSPEKVDSEMKASVPRMAAEMAARELEVATGLAQLHAGAAAPLDQRRVNSGGYNSEAYGVGDMTNDVSKLQPGQQNRIGPSSYWSVQEVTIFPTYLAHFGTDWQGIATQMGTKTQTMVKNYYYRMINASSRPDLEDMATRANDRRERGETIGLPPTPSMSVATVRAKRPELVPTISSHRMLAPNKDMESEEEVSVAQKLATLRNEYAQVEPAPVYQPLSISTTPKMQTMGLPAIQPSLEAARHNAMEESNLQDARQRYGSREDFRRIRPPLTQYPTPSVFGTSPTAQAHIPVSRQDAVYDFHSRRHPSIGERTWPAPSRPDTSHESQLRKTSLLSYHQDALQRHQASQQSAPQPLDMSAGSRIALERPMLGQSIATEAGPGVPSLTQPSSRPLSSTPFYDPSRPSLIKEDYRKDDFRAGAKSAQPVGHPLAPLKQEPRKTSNILGLLNSDNDVSKAPKHTPILRTQSPFQPSQHLEQPLQRPISQPERRDVYGDPQRQSLLYQPPSFSQQGGNSGPPRPSSRLSQVGTMPPASRPDWPGSGRSAFASLQQPSASSPQSYQSHLSRVPLLQPFAARHVPTPPPPQSLQPHQQQSQQPQLGGTSSETRDLTNSQYSRPPASMSEHTQSHRNPQMVDPYSYHQQASLRHQQPPLPQFGRPAQSEYSNASARSHNAGAPPPRPPSNIQQQQHSPSIPAYHPRYPESHYAPNPEASHRRINSAEFAPSPSVSFPPPSSAVGRQGNDERQRGSNGQEFGDSYGTQLWERDQMRDRERQEREQMERDRAARIEADRKAAEEERLYQSGLHWPPPPPPRHGPIMWRGGGNGGR